MNSDIPNTIHRLFWDMDPEQLDVKIHASSIIERVLNDGTLSDWRWLVSVYGVQTLREYLSPPPRPVARRGLRERSSRLAALLLA